MQQKTIDGKHMSHNIRPRKEGAKTGFGNTIKFSKCPIKKHKGERWEKLNHFDTSKPVILQSIVVYQANDIDIETIQEDTFSDFTYEDWKELIELFYKSDEIYGLLLTFRTEYGYEFTTYRAYDWKKDLWYRSQIGKEFKVVE